MSAGGQGAGQVIDGRFELTQRLGGGGMGLVWRAYDTALHREVALKEVRSSETSLYDEDGSAARTLRERVLREARALARLHHPNVVTIYHIVDATNVRHPWLVMELVEGGSLEDRLKRGPLAPREAAGLGRGVLAALTAAHAAGIQHRDVKPANVLLRPDGTPVLTDFGIAALNDSSPLTATGTLIGSPEYIAPERIRGEEGNPASDLWSLGMLLYVSVEGHNPLRRATTLATLAAVLNEPLPPPVQAGPLGPVLAALLTRDTPARPGGEQLNRMLAEVEQGGAPGRFGPFGEADQPGYTIPYESYRQPGLSGTSGQFGQPGTSGQFGTSGQSGRPGSSGEYRNPGQFGDSGQFGRSGESAWPGQPGQPGQSGQSGQSAWPDESGRSGRSGESAWPGQPGQPGRSGESAWPGQSGPSGQYGGPVEYAGSGRSGATSYSGGPAAYSRTAGSSPVDAGSDTNSEHWSPGGTTAPHAPGSSKKRRRFPTSAIIGTSGAIVLSVTMFFVTNEFGKGTDQGVGTGPTVTGSGIAAQPGAGATTPGSSGSDSGSGSDPGSTQSLLTPAGMKAMVKALIPVMGTSKVLYMTVYPTYAEVEVETKADPKLYNDIEYRDGVAGSPTPGGTVDDGDVTVDLNTVDWDTLPGLFTKATAQLGVKDPDARYFILDPNWPFGTGASLMIYLANNYGGGYILATTKGKVESVYPLDS